VARAEPGLTWAPFDRETQAFGLAVTGIAEPGLFERLNITGQISGESSASGNSRVGTARWILAGITIGAIAYGLKKSQEAGHG
jgi:hypothetical protein